MSPLMCLGLSAKYAQEWIKGRVMIGQWRAPYPKNFFLRLEGELNKPIV